VAADALYLNHQGSHEVTEANQPTPPSLDVERMASLRSWGGLPSKFSERVRRNVTVDCGWGKVLFAQTFDDLQAIADGLRAELPGQRDIALYLRDPQVVLSRAPQELFLDPSNTFRLPFERYEPNGPFPADILIRRFDAAADGEAANRIYRSRGMVPVHPEAYWRLRTSSTVTMLVAVDRATKALIGVVTGIDHVQAFDDPDNGSSLWSLAVDPQTALPGVGEALVRALVERYRDAGRSFLDLSVMHDNEQAIALYQKLGFEQVPVFCVKHKNEINEKLFLGPASETGLNVYARIIVDEARRRGIGVDVDDAEAGYFTLTLGGRSITCRESLSELTTAVAMSRCDDKSVTRRVLAKAGLKLPAQVDAGDEAAVEALLADHGKVVAKPARGEQGRGVSVDLRDMDEVRRAIELAGSLCEQVLVEPMVSGQDLRVIVIDNKVVAGAVRRPAEVKGDGERSVRELIERQSRRRERATQGESRIPLDAETERAVRLAGYGLDEVPPPGAVIVVRKTANLHTGGTIHDVTDRLHPRLVEASIRAAQALSIPVVGLDLLVPDVCGPDYVIIEANERPGLANHEPQPTAERFVDLLFPQTRYVPPA
jgi:GNAT-family acetyltransferase (TIGR03103 family)